MVSLDKKTVKKIVRCLGVFTAIVSILQGWFYFARETDPILKYMLIFQNTFQSFLLKSTVSLSSAISIMPENPGLFRRILLYSYAFAQIAAPVVTATALYHAIELFFRRFQYTKKRKGGEPIIIYGYNDFARNLILSAGDKYIPYVKPGKKLTNDEELELLRNRVPIFKKADEIKGVLGDVKNVILADTDIAADLGMLLDIKEKSRELAFHKDCRYHIFYDDPGDRWLSEKVCRTAIDNDKIDIEKATDIEFFDLSEIAARKAVEALPFHTWQDQTGWKDKHFHMLLVGFGSMGKQVLIKAMNQAVFASDSTMVIDVVDLDARTNSGLFFNRFRNGYVRYSEGANWDEYTVSFPQSDGRLVIRLHEVDCRLNKFKHLLGALITPQNGVDYGPFTYGMICLHDNAASIQALMGVNDMVRDFNNQDEFPVCIRVSGGEREKLFSHVKASLPYCTCVAYDRNRITLDDVLRDEREKDARRYNWMYNNIRFVDSDETAERYFSEISEISDGDLLLNWLEMEVFQKDSSRALYEHRVIKERLLKSLEKKNLLQEIAGEQGSFLKRRGHSFIIGNEKEFLEKLASYPEVEELMKTEHRRWNYFMASQGWTYHKSISKKDSDRKIHPCMTDWALLKENKPETCKYDLITYLLAEFFE